MAQVDYKKPALIGGAIVGLLSVMPLLQVLNTCLCLWAWVGGAVAAKILIDNSPEPITSREGAKVGLLTGLFGGLIFFVIETPLAVRQMQAIMDTAAKLVKEPEAVALYEKIGQTASLRVIFALLFTIIGSLFTIGFTVLGGMVGVKLFEKRQRQTPPPPYYPPPPGGEQGGWPQS